jgi:ethanolamine ammonia-lyase large subunit
MDDSKLYANSKKNSDNLLAITCNFSKSVAIELGLGKCKIINLEKGRLVQCEGFCIDDNQAIQDLTQNENYKYLGYLHIKGLKHHIIKDKLQSQIKNRIEQIQQN